MPEAAPCEVVFINIFHVEPPEQARLVSLLIAATEGFVVRAPGFLGATLHRGLDGRKVTMYARWRSLEDYEAMRGDPGPSPYLAEALTFARFEPGRYEVVRRFAPGRET